MATIEELQDQVNALEATLGASGVMVAAFEGELSRMQQTMLFTGREVNTLTNGIGGGLRKAFDGLVLDGMKLSDALRMVVQSMINSVYNAALRPIQGALGGALASGVNAAISAVLPFANGGAFSQGRVMPFAKGGVVAQPTGFAMRGGRGLMGEAGPEAIMPLARGADGRLGIQSAGGRAR